MRRGSIAKRIAFQNGDIHGSWSNQPRESLGQFLVRDRLVTEQQLSRALLRQDNENKMLGAILMEEGLIEQGQLMDALRLKRLCGRCSKAGRAVYSRSRLSSVKSLSRTRQGM